MLRQKRLNFLTKNFLSEKIVRLLEKILSFLKILLILSVLTLLPESQKQSSHFDKCNALKQI